MSSVLGGSYQPLIHRSTFNVNTYQTTSPRGFERLIQAVSSNAFHNSDDRPDPPKCHENTRVAVLNKIMDWVNGKIDTDAFILWLYGPAGTGKTAISRTIAEHCETRGLLLASFLFFRSDSKRNTMGPLVANIAYCVTRAIPGTREPISTVIEADPLILFYSVEVQLTKLVLEPLQLLANQGYFWHSPFPRLVVIDGLDECLDKGAQTNLIQLLSSSATRYQLRLKFLIASRPEAHIKLAIDLATDQSAVSHLELNNDFEPDEDIRNCLTHEFGNIKRCHPLRSRIPSSWPSEQQIITLVRKASGQFIYASLAVRFVKSPCDSPAQQLDIVLGLRTPMHSDLPFAELDTLYICILSGIKNLDLVLRILGVNAALVEFRVDALTWLIEQVLNLEDGDVCKYLSPLRSLLEVGPIFQGIIFYHSSFMDFLHSRKRSGDYYVDASQSHTVLAQYTMEAFACNARIFIVTGTRHSIIGIETVVEHLTRSLRTVELECALRKFSLGAYLNQLIQMGRDGEVRELHAEQFFNYLEAREKPELHRHHSILYLEYVVYAIESRDRPEKFHLLSTVWFILQEIGRPHNLYLDISAYRHWQWVDFCGSLFGLNRSEIEWDNKYYRLTRHPSFYDAARASCKPLGSIYGVITETERLVPEPTLSHRLARVAISCIQYLRCRDPRTPTRWYHLHAWATKSKRSPWIWRQRMRVTSARRGVKVLWTNSHWRPLTSSPSLHGLRQTLHPQKFPESEKCYRKAQIFYIWALDLLYRTLRKARQSEELTKALSKPFTPWPAPILFPRRIKRISKAITAYLENGSEVDHSKSEIWPGAPLSRKSGPSSLEIHGGRRVVGRSLVR